MIFKYKLKYCKYIYYDALNFTLYFNHQNSIILIPVASEIFKLNKLFTKLNKTKLKDSLKFIIDETHLVIMGSRGIFFINQTKKKVEPLNILDIFIESINFKKFRDKFILHKDGELVFFVTNEILREKYRKPKYKGWFLIRICYYLLPTFNVLWEFKEVQDWTKGSLEMVSEPSIVSFTKIEDESSKNTSFSIIFRIKISTKISEFDQLHEITFHRNEECEFISQEENKTNEQITEMKFEGDEDSFDSNRYLMEKLKFGNLERIKDKKSSFASLVLLSQVIKKNQVIKSFLSLENTKDFLLVMIRQPQNFEKKSINICLINKYDLSSETMLEINYDFEIKSANNKYIDAVKTIEIKEKKEKFFFVMYGDIFCIIKKSIDKKNKFVLESKFHINFEIFDTYKYVESNQNFYFILDSKLFIWDFYTSSMIFKMQISSFFKQIYGKFLINSDQMTLTCFPELLKYSNKEAEKRYLITICLKRFIILNKYLFYVPNNLGFDQLTYDYSDLVDYYNSYHMEENVFFRHNRKIYHLTESILDLDQYNAIVPPLMFLKQHISKLFRNQEAFIDEIESYCQFIFMHLKETNFVDYNFKSLNPLILLIYYNKPYILKTVMENFGLCFIPTYSYYGIFEFCLRLQRKECLREIRNYILDRSSDHFKINYHDFNALLQSNDPHNHLILSLAFQTEQESITPNFIYMDKNVSVKEYRDISILTLEENKILQNKNKLTVQNYRNKFSSYKFDSNTKNESGNFVKNLTLSFDMDLSLGSLESINLSNYFSKTPSDDFIESGFKYLIEKKWDALRVIHYTRSFSYIFFICFFILSTIFFSNVIYFKLINLFFITFVIMLEVFELFSSSCYDFKL